MHRSLPMAEPEAQREGDAESPPAVSPSRCASGSASIAIALLLMASPVFAQADRYELGRHAHAFEVAWDEKIDDAAAKKRAAPFVNQAVQQFFMLKFDGAAKEIDAARHALESADPASPAVRWADSLQIIPESRMIDAAAADLTVTLKRFYKPDAEAPAGASVRMKLGTGKPVETPVGLLPVKLKVPVKDVPGSASADFKLTAEVIVDGKVLATKVVGVSRVEKLDERLAGVKKSFAEVPNPPKTIEDASFGLLIKTLTDVAKKETPETDFPLSRFLAGAERLSKIDEPYYQPSRPGEFWLSIPTDKAKTGTVIRIRIPPKLEERKDPVPVLVALHGMGGSENVYYDGYGNGVFPRMASERGWIVIAPRVEGLLGAGPAPPVAAMLDALAKRYPIDPKRVYLVGHSMGAGHAVQLAQQDVGRYAAVAALGGGGRVSKPEALKDVPVFVGCGKLDFAINGARALHKAFEGAKVSTTLKEYDDVEHLTIVRAAAADVFKFFDAAKK
jgi:predicted esterase